MSVNKVMNEIQEEIFKRLKFNRKHTTKLFLHANAEYIQELIRDYQGYFNPRGSINYDDLTIHLLGVELKLVYNQYLEDGVVKLVDVVEITAIQSNRNPFVKMINDDWKTRYDFKVYNFIQRIKFNLGDSDSKALEEPMKKLIAKDIPFKVFLQELDYVIAVENEYMTQYYFRNGVTDEAIEKVCDFSKKILYEKIDRIVEKYKRKNQIDKWFDLVKNDGIALSGNDDMADSMSMAIHYMNGIEKNKVFGNHGIK